MMRAACIATLLCAATAASAHPTIHPFDPDGSIATFPTAISDNKRITGYFTDEQRVVHGFLRDTIQGTTAIFDPDGSRETIATGVNHDGTVAGYFTDQDGKTHGFVRSAAGVITTLDIRGGTDTRATAIDASGAITGSVTLRGRSRGFLRLADGPVLVFAAAKAQGGTFPIGINDSGAVAGNWIDKHFREHGFIRAPDGTITTFDPPGSVLTAPKQINEDGVVTGGYLGNDEQAHAFVRQADGTFASFDVPQTIGTYGVGTDDRGNLYGMYDDGSGHFHGFVKHHTGDLALFDGPDADSTTVSAANFRGLTVGGFATDKLLHGFYRTR